MNTVDYLASREDLVSPGISACQGCAAELSLRNLLKCLGRKTVLVVPPGCMAGAAVGGWNLWRSKRRRRNRNFRWRSWTGSGM